MNRFYTDQMQFNKFSEKWFVYSLRYLQKVLKTYLLESRKVVLDKMSICQTSQCNFLKHFVKYFTIKWIETCVYFWTSGWSCLSLLSRWYITILLLLHFLNYRFVFVLFLSHQAKNSSMSKNSTYHLTTQQMFRQLLFCEVPC